MTTSRRVMAITAVVLCMCLSVRAEGVFAKDKEGSSDEGGAKIEITDLRKKISELSGEIEKASAMEGTNAVEEFGLTPEEIDARITGLTALRTAYERLAGALSGVAAIEKETAEFKIGYDRYRQTGMAKRPPYPLTFLDSFLAELSALEKQKNTIDITLDMVRRAMAEETVQLETVNKGLRQHRETLAKAGDTEKKAPARAVETGERNRDYLTVLIEARKAEIRKAELEKELVSLREGMFSEQAEFVKSRLQYDEEDLKSQLLAIDHRKEAIDTEIRKLQSDLKTSETRWMTAMRKLDAAGTDQERAVIEAMLKSRDEWRKTYSVIIELKEENLALLDRQRITWQERYALVREVPSPDKLAEIQKQVERSVKALNQSLQIQQTFLVSLQKTIGALQGLLQDDKTPAGIKTHLTSQIEALRLRLDRRLEFQSVILATDQNERLLADQVRDASGSLTVTDHVSNLKNLMREFWKVEIWVVDDQSVSLGKIIVAVLILIAGSVVARFVLSAIRRRFLEKSQFKETTAAAVHKVLSYSAYLLVVLFALRMVNIPLTAFAFLGGAIAIGVGFGAQNLINNFISGFMILGERPINIGDLIEVDGLLGKVEEIGARCTRVRTGENVHKLVPNSSFLEKNITNWTLSDNRIRTKISVGVAYGSPVTQVEKLLVSAAKANPKVLTIPEPFVLFADFGDNALVFELYFWVMIRMVLEKKQIESSIRFKIDELFNREGIVIAFPQRDIHLDQSSPFSVKLITD